MTQLLHSHKPKRKTIIKFILLLLIFMGYFLFMARQYGVEQGGMVSLLTWSFFVLCTPVADAGFLIDFPVRLVTNVKMVVSEIGVWVIAIASNVYMYWMHPEMYAKTALLQIFKHILDHPVPLWGVIGISLMGTFASIYFGDELLDSLHHKDRVTYHKYKHKYAILVAIIVIGLVFISYDFLLKNLDVQIPI